MTTANLSRESMTARELLRLLEVSELPTGKQLADAIREKFGNSQAVTPKECRLVAEMIEAQLRDCREMLRLL